MTIIHHLIGGLARDIVCRSVRAAPEGSIVTIRAERRSDAMNARMHAMAGDISKQVLWCGAKLDTEDWKRVATAMLKKDKFVRDVGEDGQPGNGLIVVGARTREMSNKEVGLICDWLEWFGAKNGVIFTEKQMEGV